MNLNIMKGWIYIISNKAMPGLIKVGYSLKDPIGRAAELGTGSPYPYTVEYEALVDHPKKIEKNRVDFIIIFLLFDSLQQ